jgi:hypothetical protein
VVWRPMEHSGLKGRTVPGARPNTATSASAGLCCLGTLVEAQRWPRREDMVDVSMRGPRHMRQARKGQWGSPRKRLDARWQSGDGAVALIGGEALRRSMVSSYGIREEGKGQMWLG